MNENKKKPSKGRAEHRIAVCDYCGDIHLIFLIGADYNESRLNKSKYC